MSLAPESERRIPPSTLAKRLRDSREWRGLKQSDLAEVLGVERTTISNYEHGAGKRGIGKLAINAWAVACDVDVDWLKTGVEDTGGGSGPSGGIPDSTKITVAYIASRRNQPVIGDWLSQRTAA